MTYLKVSEDDVEYIDMIWDRLEPLRESKTIMKKGIGFRELLELMVKQHFFQGMEMTEKEPVSVITTQILIDILLQVKVFGAQTSKPRMRGKISKRVRDCNDVANDGGIFRDKRYYQNTKVLIYRF